MTNPARSAALPADRTDYPYGWRYVSRELPDGGVELDRVPLTIDDLHHPEEGDQATHSDLHQRICVYLYNVFRGLLAAAPAAVVLHDVRVAWDSPELRPHGPDLAVIFGVREAKNWSPFDVAAEGVRPSLIVEVTSPETRAIDLTAKLEEYDLAGVEAYVIVDIVTRGGRAVPRLLGYRKTPGVYAVLPPDDRGRLWLDSLGVWLGVDGDVVRCYDARGAAIGDYGELRAALAAETQARADAERRAQELEAELRRLRGEA